jgi:hypothetical protein
MENSENVGKLRVEEKGRKGEKYYWYCNPE